MSSNLNDRAEGGQVRASTLELFFDLVFVFTITQLTHVFVHHPGWEAVLQVSLMYDYALYPLLVGVILTSAGIALSIAHGGEPVSWAAAGALSGGVALYFAGQSWFRAALGLSGSRGRLLGALAVAATTPIGVYWLAWGQLATLVAVAYAVVIVDDRRILRAGQHSAYA